MSGDDAPDLDSLGVSMDSMFYRAFSEARPDDLLTPAFELASQAAPPTSFTDLVDLAEQMTAALPLDRQRPMEKAYAAIRLQLGLSRCLGETRLIPTSAEIGGAGFMYSPLSNMKQGAQSETVAKLTLQAVQHDFGRLREVAERFDQDGRFAESYENRPDPRTSIISNPAEGYVSIGGVKVAIRR